MRVSEERQGAEGRSSLLAVALGSFSVLLLLLSLATPRWLSTIEAIPPSYISGRAWDSDGSWQLRLHLGLFHICPKVEPSPSPGLQLSCVSLPYSELGESPTYGQLGFAGSPIRRNGRLLARIRYVCFLGLASLVLLLISALLTLLGHCSPGHSLMAASALFAFTGVLLGSCLLMLVATVSEECVDEEAERGCSYGLSFILATISFLATEVSALLAFSAYMEQFPRQQDFLHIIPGMHRKLEEIQSRAETGLTEAAATPGSPPLSPVPVDLLKCSFVHCSSPHSSVDTLTSRPGHSQYSLVRDDEEMNGGLRKNGSVSHRSNPAPRCDQIQQQDGQTLPGFQTPGGPGWQAVEEKSNSRDDINSNESFIGYSNQESSKESYLSYSLADNHIDSRLEGGSNTELATFPRQKRRVTILASSPLQPSPV